MITFCLQTISAGVAVMLMEDCQHESQTVSGAAGYGVGETELRKNLCFLLTCFHLLLCLQKSGVYVHLYIMQARRLHFEGRDWHGVRVES